MLTTPFVEKEDVCEPPSVWDDEDVMGMDDVKEATGSSADPDMSSRL